MRARRTFATVLPLTATLNQTRARHHLSPEIARTLGIAGASRDFEFQHLSAGHRLFESCEALENFGRARRGELRLGVAHMKAKTEARLEEARRYGRNRSYRSSNLK